ncbi:hypothetical protein J4437_08020, partial [Candidatus Woesearchaeota archaeon]|nr:hypothetical protein [Candidatus Woesearchaeota archaeon]
MDAIVTKNRIVEIIKLKGPSLPIQLAKQLNISSLFVSAFLSELAEEKRIKISSLKVGGSPLYFLEGQENQLEKFQQFLNSKEKEAFELLKQSQILRDSEQEPAIRVALRAIKDFAIAFKKDEEIFWRYILVSESDVKNILEPEIKIEAKKEYKTEKKAGIQEKEEKPAKKKPAKPKKELVLEIIKKPKPAPETPFQNPLAIFQEKLKKEKPKSEFALKVIDFINKNFKLIEEKEYKAKEYLCIVQAETNLGPINFLTQAKDK